MHLTDRDLKLIPPKGRPVKQCDHCRTARKSKSHHAKCDCGNKKDKKLKEKSESSTIAIPEISSPVDVDSPSTHDESCECHDGQSCTCGSKPESAEMRSIRRPTQTVRSRPSLTSSSSEPKLMVITNGHHPPCHRNNNLAHISGAPYPARKAKRPQTIHGFPSNKSAVPDVLSPNIQYATDDMHLGQLNKNFLTGSTASISEENLTSPTYNSPWTFEPGELLQQVSDADLSAGLDFNSLSGTSYLSWSEMSPTQPESVFSSQVPTLGTSPNFEYPTSHATFQPSDLPLSSPQAGTFSNTFTLDDSSYAAAPGLTSNSSARSETDHWAEVGSSDLPSYWSDTIQVRSNSSSVLDTWGSLDTGNDLSTTRLRTSSAVFDNSKTTLATYGDLSTSAYELSGQEDAWLGNLGTEPQTTSSPSDVSTTYWSEPTY
jgi:hypothetical protein